MRVLLVSPRKSGTHLFQTLLLRNMKFRGRLEVGSSEAGLYSLSNTFHTPYRDYFKSLDRDDFTGGRFVPIRSSLGLVVCRHPLDALLSHLEYSFKEDNTSYSSISFSSETEKLEFTLQNHFPENFMFEHYEFTAWSMMDNFLTVSYEDAVNTLLKKRANGSMHALAKCLNINDFTDIYGQSATFNTGQIGRGLTYFKKHYPEIFNNKFFKQYCEFYGYSTQSVSPPTRLDDLNADLRQLDDDRPVNKLLLVQEDFLGYRILYFNGTLYACLRNKDFVEEMQKGNVLCFAKSLEEIKGLISAEVLLTRRLAVSSQ
jgi:hypothetical protein